MNFERLNQINLERELKKTVNELDKTNSRLKMIDKALGYRLKDIGLNELINDEDVDFLNLIAEVNEYVVSELDGITSNLDLITDDLFDEN